MTVISSCIQSHIMLDNEPEKYGYFIKLIKMDNRLFLNAEIIYVFRSI